MTRLWSTLVENVRWWASELRAEARRHPTVAIALVAVCLPIIIGCVQVALSGWWPEGDDANLALKTRDVLTTHPPLLGARSTSFRGAADVASHHPGPLAFYLVAIPAALSGWAPWGFILGTALIALTAAIVAVLAARQIGGVPFAVSMAVAITFFELRVGPDMFARPFNTNPPVLPMIAMLVLIVAIVLGHHRWAPLFVLGVSLAAQGQLAFVPFALACVAFVALALVLQRIRARIFPAPAAPDPSAPDPSAPAKDNSDDIWTPRWYHRPWPQALVVAFLAWLPPLVELFVGKPNNLTQMVRYATSGGSSLAGAASPGILDSPLFAWLVPFPFVHPALRAPISVLLIVGSLALGWRLRKQGARAWLGSIIIAGGSALQLLIAQKFLAGQLISFYWMYPAAAIATFMYAWIGWQIALAVRPRLSQISPARWRPLGVALVCLSSLAAIAWAPPMNTVPGRASRPVGLISAQKIASEKLPPGSKVRIETNGGLAWASTAPAVNFQVRREGYFVCVFAPWTYEKTEDISWRSWDKCPSGTPTVYIIDRSQPASSFSVLPEGAEPIGRTNALGNIPAYELYFMRTTPR